MNIQNVALAVLLLCPISVLADIDFYAGLGASATGIESSNLIGALDNVGLQASEEMDKTAYGGQVFAGMMFGRTFGIEAKYADSGETDQSIAVTDADLPGYQSINVEASMDGFTLYGVATIPFPKRAELSFKLGYTFQDTDITVVQSDMVESASADDDGFAAAGLLRFRLGEHWAVTGELEYFKIDFTDSFDEPLRFSINGEYRF